MNRAKMGLKDIRNKNRKIYLWILILLCLLAVFYYLLLPAKRELAQNYVESGDLLLSEQKYLEAIVEYRKALFLDKNCQAGKQLTLAEKAQLDISELEIFFRQRNNLTALELLNNAGKVPVSHSEGLENVKSHIENNLPQIAEISAELLLEMDQDSKETWTYLGIARLQTARIVQMSENNRKSKLLSAKEAFAKAKELDDSYELAKEYLKEVEQLLS